MGERDLPPLKSGISLQEIQDVMADEGYSADKRKEWLKEVLTDVEQEHSRMPSEDKAQLIAWIKHVIDRYQDEDPIADDVL